MNLPAPAPPPASVAVVTGPGRGIGRAIALGLANSGIAVGLVGRHITDLRSIARETSPGAAPVHCAVADVTDATAVKAAVAEIESNLGPVDLLVSNAGLVDPREQSFSNADIDDLWRVVEVNLRGPMLMARACLPGMLARGGGRIVHVNSGFASRRGVAYTGYAVSKAGLAKLTTMLDQQYAERGIVVLDISPGLVRTGMTESMPMWRARSGVRWGAVEPIVEAVLATAAGRLDALHGRFVHAQADDLEQLVRHADEIVSHDARVMRIVPYAADDPIGA